MELSAVRPLVPLPSTDRNEIAPASGYLEFHKWPWNLSETCVAGVLNNNKKISRLISFLWVDDPGNNIVVNSEINPWPEFRKTVFKPNLNKSNFRHSVNIWWMNERNLTSYKDT